MKEKEKRRKKEEKLESVGAKIGLGLGGRKKKIKGIGLIWNFIKLGCARENF